MSEQTAPQKQDSGIPARDDELSTQELEEVAGGADVNGNCPCVNSPCDADPINP
jgi:hypothetical protein